MYLYRQTQRCGCRILWIDSKWCSLILIEDSQSKPCPIRSNIYHMMLPSDILLYHGVKDEFIGKIVHHCSLWLAENEIDMKNWCNHMIETINCCLKNTLPILHHHGHGITIYTTNNCLMLVSLKTSKNFCWMPARTLWYINNTYIIGFCTTHLTGYRLHVPTKPTQLQIIFCLTDSFSNIIAWCCMVFEN